MKRVFLKVAFVACLVGIVLTAYQIFLGKKHPNEQIKLGSIVRLVEEGGKTFCSGTVITPDLILTAGHCTQGFDWSGRVEVRARDNVSRNTYGGIVHVSPQLDQAVITGNFSIYDTRTFTSAPKSLEDVRANGLKARYISCGYPMGGDLYCNDVFFDHPLNFGWAVTGVLIPGMSGGPTMREDGTVIAVNVAVEREFSIVTPIYNLLERFK